MLADRDDGGRDPGRNRKIGGSRDFRSFPDEDDDDYVIESRQLRSHVHFFCLRRGANIYSYD